MLFDRYGRPLDNLRITVTTACNYSCVFCHREGEDTNNTQLTPDQITDVATAAYSLDIRKFKITGGEPLLREDLPEIIHSLKSIGKDVEVSLTTNGYLLEDKLNRLVDRGLDRVNVSLHAVSPQTYVAVTQVKGQDKVLRGLSLAKEYSLPVKLNYVLTKANVGELEKVLDYASKMGFNVNLIELIPQGKGKEIFDKLYVPAEEVLPLLESKSSRVEVRPLHSRPIFKLETGIQVEVIANYCNPFFCAGCTRIRLTHDGKLKTCLNRDDNLVDIRNTLMDRSHEKLYKLRESIIKANFLREPFFKINGYGATTYDGKITCPLRKIAQLSLSHEEKKKK